MIQHNLTIAFRNLFKYKLQTTISIVSIAIGIVTMSFVHSILQQYGLPTIYSQPYYERIYSLYFDSIDGEMQQQMSRKLFPTIVRTLKANDGLRSVEGNVTSGNAMRSSSHIRYLRNDSLLVSMRSEFSNIPPEYPSFVGMRSAITGEVVKLLKAGEAIISQSQARQLFGDESPIGVTFYGNQYSEDKEYTIVDVYHNPSRCTFWLEQCHLFLCDSPLEDMHWNTFYAGNPMVVLREGFSVQEMEREMNQRLEPMGLTVEATPLSEATAHLVRTSVVTRLVGYVLGFVILLTAVIGFLRLEVQLFWMRRREMALRIVHGAKFRQLYALLMLEIGLMLVVSVVLALVIDAWLSDYLLTHMASWLKEQNFRGVEPHLGICLAVGAALLFVSALVVWLTLRRIVRSQQGIAQIMRPSRNHTFRNAMLAVQLAITLFFVCVSFQLTQWASGMRNQYYLPQDDRIYKESIYLDMSVASNSDALCDSILQKQHVAQFIPISTWYFEIKEMMENESVKERLNNGSSIYEMLWQSDTLLSDYLGVKFDWFDRDIDRSACILVREEVYRILQECGVDNGSLTVMIYARDSQPLPVAGTFKGLTFDRKELPWARYDFIVIMPLDITNKWIYVAVPKGDYDVAWQELSATVRRMEPDAAETIMYNYYEHEASEVVFAETLRSVAWLLGFVCLLVSVMGIYSTIALDTRARRKEMAIRKINGAKARDIARIFAHLYIVIGIAAIATALPTAYLFHETIISYVGEYPGALASPVPPLLYGVAVVFSAIALIVGWHVRGIMRVNPADIIAKE